ncbi:DUF6634 family protein [Gymnodinialimonas sp. 2305UL16-5]|uniref:DUF6634 family protein n=1 Tax=Gymnodinialimonas mytili TaxID=3126503 RepID=UPI0030A88C00
MLDPRPFKSHGLLLRMHDWLTDPVPDDLSPAPLLSEYAIAIDQMGLPLLVGWVSGHPRLGDRWITTSPLWQIDAKGTQARTSGRCYRLSSEMRKSNQVKANPRIAALQQQSLSLNSTKAHLCNIRSIVERELAKRSH